MTRQFSYGKRILNLSLDRLKEIRESRKYRRYYIRPAQPQRNTVSRNIDFYGLLIAASIALFLISAWYAKSSLTGLLITIFIMTALTYTAFRIRKLMEREAVVHSSLWNAGKICQEKIRGIDSTDSLNNLVMEILEKLPGYSDVHIIKERSGEEGRIGVGVRALYRGVPVAVGCIICENGHGPVSSEKISHLLEEIKGLDIKGCVLVATGVFSGEARRAALELKKSVTMVDLYRLVDLARRTGHRIFPSGPAEAVSSADTKVFKYKKLTRNMLAGEKAGQYLFSAAVLFAMYYMAGHAGIIGPVYLIAALVNVGLSLYCAASNREEDLIGPDRGRT